MGGVANVNVRSRSGYDGGDFDMSDLARDMMHRRQAAKERRIAESHETVTVFVKSDIDNHSIRKYVENKLNELPGVSVARLYDEPPYEVEIKV